MSVSTTTILAALEEMAAPNYTIPAGQKVHGFWVDYYVVTAKGSRTRFQRGAGLSMIRWGQSETAVLGWLKQQHPRCDVQIMRLEFR